MRAFRLLLTVAVLGAVAMPAQAQLFGGRRQDEAIAALQQQVGALTARLDGAPGQPGLAAELSTARGELERAQSRVADLEESLRTLNGTVEGLTTELAQARQGQEAAAERNAELLARIERLEIAFQAQQQAAAAAPPPAPVEEEEPTAPEEEPVAEAPRTADGRWAAARAAFGAGDDEGAGELYRAFIAAHPRDPRIGEANHQLGETLYRRQDWTGAAAAYAASLRGWPRAPWAAESTIKLALTLGELDRGTQACQSLAEFDRRYAPTASARGRQRADAARTELGCR